MEGDLIRINEWLTPLSWLYGIGIGLRNALFDMGILKSVSYNIPIINVGNITVGGTGKTPHVEYLIRLLSAKYRVAVLSRGYKRKSRGYVLATASTPMEQIGDEAWQICQKFPGIYVAVDANRRHGIERLMSDEATRNVQVILLDDAYQHRYVKAGLNILMVDYHRMITNDRLLPAGRMRESLSAKNRAHMVVVSKCPRDITPIGIRVVQEALQLKPFQTLYFSTLRYGTPKQLFGEGALKLGKLRADEMHVLLLSAIGSPQQMEQDMRQYVQHIDTLAYPDHHYFTTADAAEINRRLAALPQPSIIITTEKDATRLRTLEGLTEVTRKRIYVLPIEVEILRNQTDTFNEKITGYVHKNHRNRHLAKGKNA